MIFAYASTCSCSTSRSHTPSSPTENPRGPRSDQGTPFNRTRTDMIGMIVELRDESRRRSIRAVIGIYSRSVRQHNPHNNGCPLYGLHQHFALGSEEKDVSAEVIGPFLRSVLYGDRVLEGSDKMLDGKALPDNACSIDNPDCEACQ